MARSQLGKNVKVRFQSDDKKRKSSGEKQGKQVNGHVNGRRSQHLGHGDEDVTMDDLSGTEDVASDEEESIGPVQRPYTVLLQALQAKGKAQRPRPKKRRRTADEKSDDILKEQNQADQDQEVIDEPDNADESEQEVNGDAKTGEVSSEDEDASDDGEQDIEDPFESHFASPAEDWLLAGVSVAKKDSWTPQKLENKNFEPVVRWTPTGVSTKGDIKKRYRSPRDLRLKKRILSSVKDNIASFDGLQQALCPYIANYQDIVFPARTPENAASLRQLASLHALNHIFKTRDRVIKNNAKLANSGSAAIDLNLRDQGFTRPKVLFLLETRQHCARYIDELVKMCNPEQQENRKRFRDAYTNDAQKFSEERPADFRELFDGNDDNDFRIGIKFTRKTIKFFSPFYTSDVLFASPLGLRRTIEKQGRPQDIDADFLSSIEMVIVDPADAMAQQNWTHVNFVFSHLNGQPNAMHGADINRIRPWVLEGQGKYLRQTLLFSAYETPEIRSLINTHCANIAGRAHIQPLYDGAPLTTRSALPLKQTFTFFPSPTITSDPDARFAFFQATVLPTLTRDLTPGQNAGGTLLFIPSYLDFVRVRNHLHTRLDLANLALGEISEYTPPRTAQRLRALFATGRLHLLIYSGRAHHFRRPGHIAGISRLIFYAPPENPLFYAEMLRSLERGLQLQAGAEFSSSSGERGGKAHVRTLVSRWDALALQRVVGTTRGRDMLRANVGGRGGGSGTFEFVS